MQALWQQVLGRDFIGDSCVSNLALGSHQPLGQGGFGYKEGTGDLRRFEASQCAKSQGDLSFCIQRRMTTGEHQAQAVVRKAHFDAVPIGVAVTARSDGDPDWDCIEMSFPDDRLRLMFTCCHPALNAEAQIALTLRTLGGLETPEIARAFLVPEPTLAQRLV